MDIKKLNPSNWFRHEESKQAASPAKRWQLAANDDPLIGLHQEIDRMFDIAFRTLGLTDSAQVLSSPGKAVFRPNVDIEGDDKVYRIGGEKKGQRERKDGNVYRSERYYGAFERVLALPDDADIDNIGANFANGVLTVQVPRKAVAQPDVRRIAIRSDDKPAIKHAA